jgi:nucleotide-binding universal stress UspA family protein
MDRILVGVDGSSSSTAAAVWAAGEAAMHNIELTIVHVVAPESEADTHTSWPMKSLLGDDVTNVVVAQGADVIDDALTAIKEINRQPPRITCDLRSGPVMPTLWEFTQEGAQMIVLGRHGRGKRRGGRLGSVTDEMLRTARCPVTVVPPEPVSQTEAGRAPVVVGVNASSASQIAIAVAFDEATRRNTQLVAVQAVAPAHGSAASGSDAVNLGAEYVWAYALAAWQLRFPNVDVRRFVTPDDPVRALLKHSRRAQLLVVGGGRRSSVIAKPFGGVSSAVAQAGRGPVIVARGKSFACRLEAIGEPGKTGRPGQVP